MADTDAERINSVLFINGLCIQLSGAPHLEVEGRIKCDTCQSIFLDVYGGVLETKPTIFHHPAERQSPFYLTLQMDC